MQTKSDIQSGSRQTLSEAAQSSTPVVGATAAHEGAVPSVVAAKSRLNKKWRELAKALLYMSPAIIAFVLFSYFPFFKTIWLSFFVTDAKGDPVRFNDVKYYSRIFNLDGSGRSEYLSSVFISFQFSLLVVPTGIVCAVGLALLATAKVRLIGVFRTIFTSSVAISAASASVVWGLLYNPNTRATVWLVNLLNLKTPSLLGDVSTALLAVAVMTVWSALGFNFIVTLAGIQAIPTDIYESGKIDGANGWNAFRFITLPLLTPTLLFLFVISTIQTFQSFTQFNVLFGNEGPEGSTNVFIYSAFKAFWLDNRYGFASAMSVVLFLILLLLTFMQFRLLDRRVHYQ